MDFCELLRDARLSKHEKVTLVRRGIFPSLLREIEEVGRIRGHDCFDKDAYVEVLSELQDGVLRGDDFCAMRNKIRDMKELYEVCVSTSIEPSEKNPLTGEIEMTCILNESKSTIVKEGKMWVVDGKYRVKKLSECKIVTEEGTPLGEEAEAPADAPQPVVVAPTPPPAPKVVAEVGVAPHAPPPTPLGENQELLEILKLVGGNVWLGFLVVAYVLGKKYLDKMDLAQSSQGKLKEQIEGASTKLTETNTRLDALTSKIEGSVTTKIEQTKSELTSVVKDTKADVSKEIEAAKKESRTMLDSIEKRVIALEMEIKYASAPKAPSGRGRKAAATAADED